MNYALHAVVCAITEWQSEIALFGSPWTDRIWNESEDRYDAAPRSSRNSEAGATLVTSN